MHSKSGSARSWTPTIRHQALRLLAGGYPVADVCRKLRLPYSTVHKWAVCFDSEIRKIADNKLRNREAFHQVVMRYNDILSVLGSPGAMDYAHVTGGAGAQYAPDKGICFQVIDFTVDVDNAVKAVLTDEEQVFWDSKIKTEDYDLTNQSEEFVIFTEVLGAEFTARGLYPITDYFGESR